MPIQFAALGLVLPNVLIDSLVAQGDAMLLFQPRADLLGASLQGHLTFHQSNHLRGHLEGFVRALAPRCRAALSLIMPVATLARIAFQFPRDSGLTDANGSGDRCLAIASFLQGFNLASLLIGPQVCALTKALMRRYCVWSTYSMWHLAT